MARFSNLIAALFRRIVESVIQFFKKLLGRSDENPGEDIMVFTERKPEPKPKMEPCANERDMYPEDLEMWMERPIRWKDTPLGGGALTETEREFLLEPDRDEFAWYTT